MYVKSATLVNTKRYLLLFFYIYVACLVFILFLFLFCFFFCLFSYLLVYVFFLFCVCIASRLSCYKAFTLLQSRSDIFCILLRHTVNLVTAVWVANNLFYVYILINHYSVFNLDFCKVISSPHRVKYKRLLTRELGRKACILRGAV